MPRYLTKTFTESRYWERSEFDPLYKWVEIPRVTTGEIPLDAQIREWVERTQAVIVHPGQLGLYSQMMDDRNRLRCTTFGQTVLYVEADTNAQPESPPPSYGNDHGPERSRAEPAGVTITPTQPPPTNPGAPFGT
jgi:hypothetical protein